MPSLESEGANTGTSLVSLLLLCIVLFPGRSCSLFIDIARAIPVIVGGWDKDSLEYRACVYLPKYCWCITWVSR